jgi:hypothetical protein
MTDKLLAMEELNEDVFQAIVNVTDMLLVVQTNIYSEAAH